MRRKSLAEYERQATEEQGRGVLGAKAGVNLDRGEGRVSSNPLRYDVLPTLTRKGPAVFLFAVADLGAPDCERQIFRWLTIREGFLVLALYNRQRTLTPSIPVGLLKMVAWLGVLSAGYVAAESCCEYCRTQVAESNAPVTESQKLPFPDGFRWLGPIEIHVVLSVTGALLSANCVLQNLQFFVTT